MGGRSEGGREGGRKGGRVGGREEEGRRKGGRRVGGWERGWEVREGGREGEREKGGHCTCVFMKHELLGFPHTVTTITPSSPHPLTGRNERDSSKQSTLKRSLLLTCLLATSPSQRYVREWSGKEGKT